MKTNRVWRSNTVLLLGTALAMPGLPGVTMAAETGEPTRAIADSSLPPDMVWLPAGEGRETVYYSCSGCHSIRLVAQQGLPRDRWQELLEWMVDEQGMMPLEQSVHQTVLDYLAQYLGVDHRQ